MPRDPGRRSRPSSAVEGASAARTRSALTLARTPRVRPLLVRPGARFECFGDGLCCTDIHALGPVTRSEKRHLQQLSPGCLVRSEDLLAPVFRTAPSGACVLRSERGCELHAVHGASAKPTGCARFPFNLVATPEGGRITTEHRCPCRTLGPPPPLTAEAAEGSLLDPAGRLTGNGRVGPRLLLAPGRRVEFSRFRSLEDEVIRRLLALEDPVRVFEEKPLARLVGERWSNVADQALSDRDGTAYGAALYLLGQSIQVLGGSRKRLDLSERPWSPAFDRAERRSRPGPAGAVLADFLADVIWSLDWVFSVGSFAASRRELASIYAISLQITASLARKGVREDRAAAEAVTVVELARQSEAWSAVHRGLRGS